MPKLDAERIEFLMKNHLIPPQPTVLKQLEDEYRSGAPDVDKIVQLVTGDVILTASFLKIINTPLFMKSHKIETTRGSIGEAIHFLGLERTKRVIDKVALMSTLEQSQSDEMQKFWDSAAEIAIICEAIVDQLGFPFAHEAYLVGMFHDVGIPMMLKGVPGYAEFIVEANRNRLIPLSIQENDTFNLNHQTVGYCITRAWNFPEIVSRAILVQHTIEKVHKHPVTSPFFMINIINSVLEISIQIHDHFRALNRGFGLFQDWEPINDVIPNNLGLTMSELDILREDILERLDNLLLSRGR